ncbi:MAG: chromosome partitioning protein ParB [Alphaproteobacteria bacterium]|nr:chromosome partitioning protein ParB [Alphaproteobacteria bacterium]
MLKTVAVSLEQIYVPSRFRHALDQGKVDKLARDILENGLKVPIHVREGKGRYVLVEGLHRLEAARALGEETIDSLIVRPHRA